MEIFDYDNILLLPRKCRVESRSGIEAGRSPQVRPLPWHHNAPARDRHLRLRRPPLRAAGGAGQHEDGGRRSHHEQLAASGHFYVMHRFDLDSVAYARRMRDKGLFVSISAGVKPADAAVIDQLAATGIGADYITIDIAHGHAESVRR
jgi:GMP reductase